MKLLLLTTVVTCIVTGSVSGQSAKQNDALEQTIRKLELAESDAVVRSDLAALDKLWAEDFTVNNPNECSGQPGNPPTRSFNNSKKGF